MNHQTNPILSKEQLEKICASFQLGHIQRVNGKIGGSYNVNLKIRTSQGSFVIRLLNQNITEEHLRYATSIQSILHRSGLPVLSPLTTQNNEEFLRFNEKLLQVTPFVKGLPFKCQAEQVFASGRTLRQFHELLTCVKPGPIPNWSFYPQPEFFSHVTDRLRSVFDENSELLTKITRWKYGICEIWDQASENLPKTVIHADWHFWNMNYAKNGEIDCLFDFDFIQWGCRVHDVAYALWVIYLLLADQSSKDFDKTFLSGYGPLTELEQQLLPYAIARISLFFLCYSFYSPNPQEKMMSKIKKHEPFIDWMLSDGRKHLSRLF